MSFSFGVSAPVVVASLVLGPALAAAASLPALRRPLRRPMAETLAGTATSGFGSGRRPGIGTFVTGTLAGASLAAHGPLRRDLRRWLGKARRAGLDDESIEALFASTFRSAREEDIA